MPTDFLSQLSSGLSEILVYAGIALVTLVGVIKCIYPVLRNGTLLNHAVVKLEKSTAAGERPAWREARFLGRALRADWQRFLLNAGQLSLRGMPCNTEEYINEDTVVYKPGHAQLAELIPSLLTSLGILGTFMGLMSGLTGLDFATAEGTITSIPTLLQGMRFAFATSVAGIACSLLFNMTNRIVVGRAFKALDSFDEAFYELAMPRPLEPEVQLLCQKQDDERNLQRAADSIGNHVAGMLEMAISRAMHPLTLSMDNFIKGATQEQVEGIQKVSAQFVTQLNATLDGQLNALGDTMSTVTREQMQMQQGLHRSLQTSELLAADAARIQEASRGVAQGMQELNDTMRKERERRELQDAQTREALANSGHPLYRELENLTASLALMKTAVDGLTERLSEARDQLPPVESERESGLFGLRRHKDRQSGPGLEA